MYIVYIYVYIYTYVYPPPCPQGTGESVQGPMTASWRLWVLTVYRDPHPHYLRGSHGGGSIFLNSFGTPIFQILVPTWPHFASQLGPKINPKSIQETSKITSDFWSLFDRCLIDLWSTVDQKSNTNQSTNRINNTNNRKSKNVKFNVFLYTFATSAMSCYSEKSRTNVRRSIQKQLSNQHANMDRFWIQLGPILRGFWDAK